MDSVRGPTDQEPFALAYLAEPKTTKVQAYTLQIDSKTIKSFSLRLFLHTLV